NRLHAVGTRWWDQGDEQRRSGKNSERSRHKHLSARAGMAAASMPSGAADSRHIFARAPRGKYGGAKNSAQRGGVEDDRCASEPKMISAGAWIGFPAIARNHGV